MNQAFANTQYFLALTMESDAFHRVAKEFLTTYRGNVITSDWVLLEVADALYRPRHRPLVRQLVTSLREDPSVTIVEANIKDVTDAWSLYFARDDKDWSLTDCLSFIIMQRLGISDAVTGDQHFAQAGFKVLLPRSSF